jgi:hypothetical protein
MLLAVPFFAKSKASQQFMFDAPDMNILMTTFSIAKFHMQRVK